jgi:hypothetical protein
VTSDASKNSIAMTPDEEQAVLAAKEPDEATEPADEGVGAHTDAADDDRYTEN